MDRFRKLRIVIPAVFAAALAACDGGGSAVGSTREVFIQITTPEVELAPGETAHLTATVSGGASSGVSEWRTSSPSVATVDGAGNVTGLADGEATVTAVYGSATSSATVRVKPKQVASVVVTPDAVILKAIGDSVQLSATAYDGNGKPVSATPSFTTADSSIVSVTPGGRVRARGTGLARVVAAAGGKADTSMIQVIQLVTAVALSPAAVTLATGQSLSLQAVATDAGGAVVPGTGYAWASSNPAVATVDAAGNVRTVAAGRAMVSATTASGAAAQSQVDVQAAQVATLSISPASFALDAGQSAQAVAVAKDAAGNVLTGRAVTWSSSSPAVANVSPLGVVFALAGGSATITATSEGKTATAAVTVKTATTGGGTSSSVAAAFQDGFESGALALAQSGYTWIGGGLSSSGEGVVVSGDVAHSGSRSLKFVYLGNPDLCADGWAEQRFQLGENLREVWLEYWFYLPGGGEGGSARFYHRTPSCPAENDVNGTTSNNKFLALWDVNYGSQNVKALMEFRRNPTGQAGDSYLYGMWGSDTRTSGDYGRANSAWMDAFTDARRGRWTQIRVHVKTADTKEAANGMVQLWADGVLRIDMQGLDLAALPGGNNFFRNGYLMGWSNSGFNANTSFYIDDFRIYRSNPGW